VSSGFDTTGFPRCGNCGALILTEFAHLSGCHNCGSLEITLKPARIRLTTHSGTVKDGESSEPETGTAAPTNPHPPAAVPVPPKAIFEIDHCDRCTKSFSVEVLTPVMDEGLLCPHCVDVVRVEAMGA
jgi:hypothetical protein